MVVGPPYKNMKKIPNWINGSEVNSESGAWLKKVNPVTERVDSLFSDSTQKDVEKIIKVSQQAFAHWSQLTPVNRGQILFDFVDVLKANKSLLTKCVARETGKSYQDAFGEVGAAIAQGEFFAGEGRRLYSNSLNSAVVGKFCQTIRQPHGPVGLIVPANTPIANIAWKIFPALICGNTAILKASEDAPEIALLVAKLAKKANVPNGVLNVIQGHGHIVGEFLIRDKRIPLISFTGSTTVGKHIATVVGERMGRVSLELGGKNPFIVCDDADIESAVNWCALSAFSNAGQRCAAASRIIIFESIYDNFIKKLIKKSKTLILGVNKNSDLGPVINKKQYSSVLKYIENATKEGGNILSGQLGNRLYEKKGYYIKPTLIENVKFSSEIFNKEVFGPVATVHKARDEEEALRIANKSEFGLTAAVHTKNINRGLWFAKNLISGTVNINSGTYGSEPHMPFGGFGSSGNGTREPGTEALNVYSELKNLSFLTNLDTN